MIPFADRRGIEHMVARYEAHDSSKDAAEWPPTINRYWFADTVVKIKYT